MKRTIFHLVISLLLGLSPATLKAEPPKEIDAKMERFFQLATEHANAEAIKMLQEPGFATAADKDGQTALYAAAGAGNDELLTEVLRYPHDLKYRDKGGCTVVWFVAGTGKTAILKRLLQLGAPARYARRSRLDSSHGGGPRRSARGGPAARRSGCAGGSNSGWCDGPVLCRDRQPSCDRPAPAGSGRQFTAQVQGENAA